MRKLRTPSISALSLVALVHSTMLAAAPPPAVPSAWSDEEVHLTLIHPDGSLLETAASVEDFSPSTLGALPSFTVDGNEVQDPVASFDGRQTEIALATGETLVLERQGRVLRRVAGWEGDDGPALSVSWNNRMDTLRLETAQGVGVVTIEGLESPLLRSRYFAELALRALGAHPAPPELATPHEKLAPVIVISLAALGLFGYLACVFGGTQSCSDAAIDTCSPWGVHDFAVVCGAGTDVQGNFQLGYNCSFICNDPPPPSGGGCLRIEGGALKRIC